MNSAGSSIFVLVQYGSPEPCEKLLLKNKYTLTLLRLHRDSENKSTKNEHPKPCPSEVGALGMFAGCRGAQGRLQCLLFD